MAEGSFRGVLNRLLQLMARSLPGADGLRVQLHRWRGVRLGEEVWIGSDVILETSYPHLVTIGNRSRIGIRVLVIGHFRGSERLGKGGPTVCIEDEVYIGPGTIILPNVTIGKGAVVSAGSVVHRSVPPGVMVQGNPCRAVARCGKPLVKGVSMEEFTRHLRPLRSRSGEGTKLEQA